MVQVKEIKETDESADKEKKSTVAGTAFYNTSSILYKLLSDTSRMQAQGAADTNLRSNFDSVAELNPKANVSVVSKCQLADHTMQSFVNSQESSIIHGEAKPS